MNGDRGWRLVAGHVPYQVFQKMNTENHNIASGPQNQSKQTITEKKISMEV